jgi:hypothetical protein
MGLLATEPPLLIADTDFAVSKAWDAAAFATVHISRGLTTYNPGVSV